jgi:hypothetical protein
MAMNNLLSVGESELALIGCATTVEWFLNTAFPALCRADKRGRRISAAIPAALQSGLLDFLDADRRASLLDLAHRRNAFAHGAPPDRDSFQRIPEGVDTEYVRSCLFLALDVYRAVNLHTGVSRNESTPKAPVVED